MAMSQHKSSGRTKRSHRHSPKASKKAPANPRLISIQLLIRVVEDDAFSHILLNSELAKHADLSSTNRALISRIFYGTLGKLRTIDCLLGEVQPTLFDKSSLSVLMVLRSAVYQMRYLSRVPTHAIVNEAVKCTRLLGEHRAAAFVNAILRKVVEIAEKDFAFDTPYDRIRYGYNFSDALANWLLAHFEDAEAIAHASQLEAPLTLRVNRSLISREDVCQKCANCVPVENSESAVVADGMTGELRAMLETGECAVQDLGSQRVVEAIGDLSALPRRDGKCYLWDACCGNGGKSQHLIELANLTPDLSVALTASDLFLTKIERLKKRVERGNVAVRAVAHDDGEAGSIVNAPFSCVLVDAPCSGYGVWRRHPETRTLSDGKDLEALAELQGRILHNASRHLMPGGLLIYAVCTFSAIETEAQISRFLAEHADFSLEPVQIGSELYASGRAQLMPHRHQTDGFFIARLRRKG